MSVVKQPPKTRAPPPAALDEGVRSLFAPIEAATVVVTQGPRKTSS